MRLGVDFIKFFSLSRRRSHTKAVVLWRMGGVSGGVKNKNCSRKGLVVQAGP
ncbi:hypothetical protein [Paraburkholderia bonniea]|uniref:hypothetical protein n=1 Tax=Paraburkholderia bonniea TaxID=2152891 RepID=UPI0015805ADD|nr:hypothetical protein [Paraburkholderia bonniea]